MLSPVWSERNRASSWTRKRFSSPPFFPALFLFSPVQFPLPTLLLHLSLATPSLSIPSHVSFKFRVRLNTFFVNSSLRAKHFLNSSPSTSHLPELLSITHTSLQLRSYFRLSLLSRVHAAISQFSFHFKEISSSSSSYFSTLLLLSSSLSSVLITLPAFSHPPTLHILPQFPLLSIFSPPFLFTPPSTPPSRKRVRTCVSRQFFLLSASFLRPNSLSVSLFGKERNGARRRGGARVSGARASCTGYNKRGRIGASRGNLCKRKCIKRGHLSS